jgi:hypothetical protein
VMDGRGGAVAIVQRFGGAQLLINLTPDQQTRASGASEPRERSAPTERRARERVGESEGR